MTLVKGFHGDPNLLKIIAYLTRRSKVYIETGTHVGHTFNYMLRTYSHLTCFGCEPVKGRFAILANKVGQNSKAHIYNETAQKFIRRIARNYSNIFSDTILFWIDAHSKFFAWPLQQEIAFFTKRATSGFILIDDFAVPGKLQFRFNKYGNQRYTFNYVKKAINPACDFYAYYPKYGKGSARKSMTGWLLLQTNKALGRLDKIFPKLVELVVP